MVSGRRSSLVDNSFIIVYPPPDCVPSSGLDCFNALLAFTAADDVDDDDDDDDDELEDEAWSRHSVSISSTSADTSVCCRRNRSADTHSTARNLYYC